MQPARCVFSSSSGSIAVNPPTSGTSRWRAVVRVLRSPVDALACSLLPASCVLCGASLPRLSSAPICDACWTEFPSESGAVCVRCGDSLAAPESPQFSEYCRACRLVPPPFQRAVAYGVYQGRLRDAIHALKYDRVHPAARGLGRMLALAIGRLAGEAPVEMLVVPVPLHRSKYSQRGFNQARMLAREALRSLRKSHPQWRLALAPGTLMRLRVTASQAGLTPRQRRVNVRGAFSVSDAAAVAGRHVLLIDDIMTTGATARAASQALLRAGAESVWVATLARARRITAESRVSFENADNLKQVAGEPAVFSQAAGFYSTNSSAGQPSF
ncbi:MAG TPA: ComF family protein [Terracidiphilus sp.]|nr:ComF family protein [Terracidiphilus sp.]